jgi:NDP-sugar pyrophosphorylase family protein/aminoglycoside/choline kinase family phosphotransferase
VETIQAFILAAGYGERLRPITDHIPKPLLPILGRPVIELVLEKLSRLPVKFFGINIHHKSEMLMQWAASSPYRGEIELFQEKAILGTGGGLNNAREFLKRSTFIVHNADILSDISLERLVEEHFSSENILTLAVHDYEKFNNLWTDSAGNLRNVGKSETEGSSRLCKMAFTGIAVYSPDFLGFLPEGNSSVVEGWRKALSTGRKIGTVDFSGCSWSDIGTPESYSSAVFEALQKEGETLYVHPSAECGDARIDGKVVLERGSAVGSFTCLKNCIVLPNTLLPAGSRLEEAIAVAEDTISFETDSCVAQDRFSEKILDKFFQKPLQELKSELIGTGGSDRNYFRLSDKKKTAVLMVCTPDDPDYERHIAYTEFFSSHSLQVPEMFDADRERKQALFEDLGDLSLYSWLKCRREPEMIEDIYRKVLDILVKLHSGVSHNSAECPLLASRIFDYEHFRWETGYFTERFVSGLLGMTVADRKELEEEFHRLAETVDSFPKAVVHRDFQSQNLMIGSQGIPKVIDYQGARMGPPAYDLASVLWDPYYRLDDDMRERLVQYYIEERKTGSFYRMDANEFRDSLLLCRLQRHMQALGAYGFLSQVKGKKYFLKHIPKAMQYLAQETALVCEDFPSLNGLVAKLNASYEDVIAGR